MAYQPGQFTGLITVTTLSKLLLNTSRRLIYPFAPEIARGLDVSHSAVTSVIAVNQATGILGPVCASFADRYGYRLFMLAALAMLTIAGFILGMIPIYSVFIISSFLTGFAKSIFDTSLQAYIGNVVRFENRGKIIGITELSWAGSTLLGIPLTGLVIERFSWQTPFFIIGGLSLACLLVLLIVMPKIHPVQKSREKNRPSLAASWKKILKSREVLAILGFAFFISLANDNLFVVYGIWLEQTYQLSLVSIGLGTILIGLAELMGEGFTAAYSDRLGLKRTIIIGTLLCTAFYFILPLADIGVGPVLTGLFLIFFTFEFAMVTTMSLATELVPELRASTMSAFYAVAGVGRVIGAFSGGLLWDQSGILSVSLFSGGCMILSLACFALGFFPARNV